MLHEKIEMRALVIGVGGDEDGVDVGIPEKVADLAFGAG